MILVKVIIQTRAVFCPALQFVVMSLSDDDISYSLDLFCLTLHNYFSEYNIVEPINETA